MKSVYGLQITAQLSQVKEASQTMMHTPELVYKGSEDISKLAQEAFCVITLDTQNHQINRHLITLGLVNSSLIHAREVFRPAITDGATSIILLHNHPSGDPTPSAADVKITKKLVSAGEILEICVLDHVVIGRPADGRTKPYCSMREDLLASFS